MTFIKKYWILEIVLGLIAIGGVGTGVYNYASANENEATDGQDSGIVLVAEQNDAQTAVLAEDDLDEALDDEALDIDEDFSDDDEAEDVEEDEDGALNDEGEYDFEPLTVAAELIGRGEDYLEEGLANGRSLADIATENNISSAELVTVLVEKELAAIDALVTAGGIDREEANELREEIALWTPFWVETPYLEPAVIAANGLGVDVEAVWDALDSNQTIEQIAIGKGVEPQVIVQAIIDSEMKYMQAMLSAGLLDEDELDEMKAEVSQFAQQVVSLPESRWEEDGDEGEEANDD